MGEILEGVFGGVLRFLGRALAELVLELMIRGSGYLFCRIFSKKVNPDSISVLVAGILIWLLIILGGYKAYMYMEQQAAIENCLNSGQSFNYSENICEKNKGS